MGFCGLFGQVYTLPILVWNRVWCSRELPERMKVFIVSEKKIEICEFEMRLEKCFLLRSNLSNYDVISA